MTNLRKSATFRGRDSLSALLRTHGRSAAADECLIAAVRAGEERGFELIYERYHRRLLSFCRHMLGSHEEAEDALQQVFVAAHRQLSADKREVDLRPWLYAIARNRCLSVLRARRQTVALDDVPEAISGRPAVAADVEQREELRDMLLDISRLPEDQRAALLLSELEALSHEQVAAVLDVRREKVKALVFQARQTLMGYRQAREADCEPFREQLATLRGSALRRGDLRRHVAVCAGCMQFKQEVSRQRALIGAVLPVVPAFRLKERVFDAVQTAADTATGIAAAGGGAAAIGVGGGASTGAVGAAGVGAGGGAIGVATHLASSGIAVKALAISAVAASAGGGVIALHDAGGHPSRQARAADEKASTTPAARAAIVTVTATGAARPPGGVGGALPAANQVNAQAKPVTAEKFARPKAHPANVKLVGGTSASSKVKVKTAEAQQHDATGETPKPTKRVKTKKVKAVAGVKVTKPPKAVRTATPKVATAPKAPKVGDGLRAPAAPPAKVHGPKQRPPR